MQIRNTITLIGNVGKQPEVFHTKEGEAFLRFSLATNEYYRDRDGNRVTQTEWHNVVVFGKMVEYLKENLQKGTQLAVQGSLRYRKWVDKHDQQRVSAVVRLADYTFLSPRAVAEETAAA